MTVHEVTGGGGVKLHVREFGQPDGPEIVLIHGWSQHHMCWFKQTDSSLAETFRIIALDLRSHGMSDAPRGKEHYTDGDLWADDVHAVLTHLNLKAPVLSGWSYGGLVMADYVRKYGDSALGGLNFVGAAIVIGKPWFGTHIGAGFLDHAPPACSEDQPTAMRAIRAFVHTCVEKSLPDDEIELAVAWNMLVRPDVRLGLISREQDCLPILKTVGKPVLVTHGRADRVLLPRMSEDALAAMPHAEASWYDGVGHTPFLENAERFNRELAAFAETVSR
ncbi:MAG: alpha/beta hydrolase [Pseudomonadota bacterium]